MSVQQGIGILLLLCTACASAQHAHEPSFGYTQGDRLEYRETDDALLWDLQGRYGGDYRRFAWKTEGLYGDGGTEEAELQLLYERSWTPFFDLQFGLRHARTETGEMSYAVVGTQGLMPYRIESDLALFLSEDGDLTSRAEFEKDLLLTERLSLQPRIEIGLAFQDIPERFVVAGLVELTLGLRLRYDLTRKFAPYLGIAWTKHYSGPRGEEDGGSAVAGIRFWF